MNDLTQIEIKIKKHQRKIADEILSKLEQMTADLVHQHLTILEHLSDIHSTLLRKNNR